MTKSRGIGTGRYERVKGRHGRPPKIGRPEDGPTYYLNKHKTTNRPSKCQRCSQNAYYYHDDFGNLCAPHLLDLVNIGQLAFYWEDYPEVWERTERLLAREPLSTEELCTTVEHVEPVDIENNAVKKRGRPKKLDGWNQYD